MFGQSRRVGQPNAAPPAGDPQLTGLLSWASAVEDASNGLMPNDGAISVLGGASYGTNFGRLSWRSSAGRTARIVKMVATYAPRSPLVVTDVYYDATLNDGTSKRIFGLPVESKEHGMNLYVSQEGAASIVAAVIAADAGFSRAYATTGSMPSDTWFSSAFGMENTVDGGDGKLRWWKDAVEAGYSTADFWTGLVPWQSGADAYFLNYNTAERSIRGCIADFRIYDIEQIDPSYNSIEELLADIRDNRDRPLGDLP